MLLMPDPPPPSGPKFDILLRVMRHWAGQVDVQWVVLGTGEPRYHHALEELARALGAFMFG